MSRALPPSWRHRFATLLVLLALPPASWAQVPSPEERFGFRMGADRQLATAEGIEAYFELAAAQSDRVQLVDLGRTTEGRRTIAAIVSAPENIRNLDRIQQANRRLADPRTLTDAEARELSGSHRAVVAIGASIHASEIGATQAANELLYELSTAADPGTLAVLENVIVILIPSLNPDGHRLVVDWYERHKGTPYEGGAMPWLYHKYAGHDINRDGFMMNLAETRNLARFFYTEWHPQVFLTMHQMGSTGPRFFVPPNTDPIDTNYDPLIWRTAALLGSAMALEMQRQGRRGVMSNGMYDYYWPGYEDSAPLGHNTVCLLTEVASVNVASPITVNPGDLRGGVKGLQEYRPQINFPDPWPGGTWTLRDIVEYDLTAVRGLLEAVSAYRRQIVENFYEMGRRAVEAGRRGGPFAFLIPPDQYDPHATARLEELLLEGRIEIHRALEPFRADGEPYPEGTGIILLAQPFRAYVKTLLERQRYPAAGQLPVDSPERPYDVVGWTLPAQMGVSVVTIERSFEPPAMSRLTRPEIRPANVWGERRPGFYVIEARGNGGALAINRLVASGARVSWLTSPLEAGGHVYKPGSIVVQHSRPVEPVVSRIASELGLRADGVRGRAPGSARPVGDARLALYKPWIENIDEGWTRWLLERYDFPFISVSDADLRVGNLRARYDAIVLPSAPPERLIAGHPDTAVPPEYAGGLGTRGVQALKEFIESGGTLICLDQSCGMALDHFGVPLEDVAAKAGDRLFCPGSVLRLDLAPDHPLAYGMPPQSAAFFAFSAAYGARPAAAGSDGGAPGTTRTAARYASSDLLVSGWLEGGDVIAGQAAVVEAEVGRGRVVLLGFRVQHRAQSDATFRLLFNAIFDAGGTRPAR
jgi:hypothetical protein